MYTKNQLLTIDITDFTNEGEGVGKVDGFTFFVKDTIIGDRAEIIVTKVKKTYGYGRLKELIIPSKDRVESICPVARQCGGCQIQSMSYEAQLRFKENKVKNNLVRLGGFSADFIDSIMEPIIGASADDEDTPVGFGYRNKAQFPFGLNKDGEIVCGFYAGRTHTIIQNIDCALGAKENKDILSEIIAFMKEYHVMPYDEVKHNGVVRHALLRRGYYTKEIMVCLVINKDKLPHSEELVKRLVGLNSLLEKSFGSRIASISYSVNKNDTNVIMGDNYHTLWGNNTISDKLLGLSYDISPLSFYQVNPIQVEKLYGTAIEFADLKGDEEVWDLCCGIGTITLSVAKKMAELRGGVERSIEASKPRVHGIEIVPQAIEDAKNNAVNNMLDNVEFICAPVEEYLPAHADSIRADVIIMDPPRKGIDEAALRVVVNASPEKIVYVSCDSATLARDLKYLCANGYELKRVRATDMFGMTVHVETVCLLSKLHEAKHHVSVKLDMDEMDITSAESNMIMGT